MSLIKKFFYIINLAIRVFFLNDKIKLYIKFNKKNWSKNKVNVAESKGIFLLEIFDWYPLIHFWSYIVNIIGKKEKLEIKFFYFPLHKSLFYDFLRFKILEKIYNSFNAFKGINFYNLNKNNSIKNKYKDILFKNIFSREDIINYSRNGIRFGDLIYDSYLRVNFLPTIENIRESNFIDLFINANIIFDGIWEYFKKNNVKFVMSSHSVYLQYGLICRIADFFGAKILKVHDKANATSNFGLKLMDKGLILQDFPYYNYKFFFNKFNEKKKKYGLLIGKKIIEKRFYGQIDYSTPYMKASAYNKKTFNLNLFKNNKRKKIVLFSHCFFDEPHRFRSMLFSDFYQFIIKTSQFIALNRQFELYIKPHPNGLPGNQFFFEKLKKLFLNCENIIFLDSNVNNNEIILNTPDLALTIHGTVTHELAYHGIPVINAGDNPHINYSFSLHPKNLDDYFNMIKNINIYRKKINFKKEEIYEFLYMHYHYFLFRFQKETLLLDEYFINNSSKKNKNLPDKKINDEAILDYFTKNSYYSDLNIKKYILNFIKSEIS